jgi:hypothetical protein
MACGNSGLVQQPATQQWAIHSLRSRLFYDVTPYSLVDNFRCAGGTDYFHLQDRRILYPEDEYSRTVLLYHENVGLNVGKDLPDYTESHSRRFNINFVSSFLGNVR